MRHFALTVLACLFIVASTNVTLAQTPRYTFTVFNYTNDAWAWVTIYTNGSSGIAEHFCVNPGQRWNGMVTNGKQARQRFEVTANAGCRHPVLADFWKNAADRAWICGNRKNGYSIIQHGSNCNR